MSTGSSTPEASDRNDWPGPSPIVDWAGVAPDLVGDEPAVQPRRYQGGQAANKSECIPNATLAELIHHKGLGIHTDMFADGVIDPVERGVITGEHKTVLPYRIVSSFVMGSQRVYDFIDNNPAVALKQASFTNDTAIIRRNLKVTAINSAIEIDLTGQVCADTIGTMQYSGVGVTTTRAHVHYIVTS